MPGVAVCVGGLLLMAATSRIRGIAGGLLASAGGAWFVLGPILSTLWEPTGLRGNPVGTGGWAVAEQIGLFAGLGVVVLFLSAGASGRFTIRGHRDAEVVDAERERRARRARARTVTAGVPGPGPAIADPAGARALDEANTHVTVDCATTERRTETTIPEGDPRARHW